MKTIIIAGGGKFGEKAIKFAQKNNFLSIVIDSDPDCMVASLADIIIKDITAIGSFLKNETPSQVIFINQDITIAMDLLDIFIPEYVIPVIPIHFLAKLIERFLKKHNITLIKDSETSKYLADFDINLILNIYDEHGVAYFSHAKQDEICPDNCSGPVDYCPNFKREKPKTMTEEVRDYFNCSQSFQLKLESISIYYILAESEQLASGLGGISGKQVKLFFDQLLQYKNSMNTNDRIVIATTCNCHGVVNFYKVQV